MSLLSLPVAMAAAITAYVGIYHLWLHLRRPSRSDLYFALTCFCMVSYDAAAAFHYSATSNLAGGFWQRLEIVSVATMGMPLMLLVNEQVEVKTPRWGYFILSLFPVAALVGLFERSGWLITNVPLPKHVVAPWGSWTLHEMALGPLYQFLALLVPLMVFYCLWASLGAVRIKGGKWVRRHQRSSPLVFASAAMLVALAHDLLVGTGVLHHPYTLEYAWLGVAIVMSWMLSQEVFAASETRQTLDVTLHRETTTLNAIQDAVITTNLEGKIAHLNPGAEKLLATTLEKAVGQPFGDFVEITSPETNTVVNDPIRFAVGRPTNPYGQLPQLVTTDGNERRVDLGGAPLKGQDGRVQGAIVVMRDLTLQHQALDSLQHAKKMESMGQLAGGTAHDLNNLLTPIMSYVELVQRETDGRSAEFLDHVQEAAQRAAGLTRQLLALSRKQVLDVHVIQLSEFVRQTEPLLQRLVGEKTKLTVRVDDRAGRVSIDLGQFEQVLLNLVANARDATADGGDIKITVRPLSGADCCLEVSDTGSGMDADTASRIFEPFFTTKERGKGTGLGLASVRGIVEQHGGSIFVDSEPGEGTSFEIVLPQTTAQQPNSSIRTLPNAELARGSEHILVVEDDPAVRSLIHDALTQLGYTVHSADGLAMAVHLAETETLDLLLTDVILPGADGPRIRDAVNQKQPLPCLFMTGHADDRLGEHGIIPRGTEVLRKPFRVAELGLKVRQVLDRETHREKNPA